jgi:acylphosphatase
LNPVAGELLVAGVVQGVGYRYFCLGKATELGLIGQVSNQPDGSVRVWAEGDRATIEALIIELKLGPPAASVSDVAVKWHDPTGAYGSFNIEMGQG